MFSSAKFEKHPRFFKLCCALTSERHFRKQSLMRLRENLSLLTVAVKCSFIVWAFSIHFIQLLIAKEFLTTFSNESLLNCELLDTCSQIWLMENFIWRQTSPRHQTLIIWAIITTSTRWCHKNLRIFTAFILTQKLDFWRQRVRTCSELFLKCSQGNKRCLSPINWLIDVH